MTRLAGVGLMAVVAVLASGLVSGQPLPNSSDNTAERPPKFSLKSATLYPPFDRRRHNYVVRCRDGAVRIDVETGRHSRVRVASSRPRSGDFRAAVRLMPGQDLEVDALSDSGRETYNLRCLPVGFPQWAYQRLGPVEPGLFTVTFPSTSTRRRGWVVVFDHLGTPRWWYSPSISALGAQIHRDGTITWSRSFGDGYGVHPRMAHEVRSLSGDLVKVVRTQGSITDSHEHERLPSGNALVTTFAPRRNVDLRGLGNKKWQLPRRGSAVLPEVQEIDPNGRLVWRWNAHRRIGIDETPQRWRDNVRSNPHPGPGGIPTYDPLHINSIDPWGSAQVVVSMRHADAVYGIDRSTGDIVWKLGGTPTEHSLRVIGDPHADLLFGGQHDARISREGTLSVFDNGKDRPRPPRAVWYELDLERRTATFRRQLSDPMAKTSHCCGSLRSMNGGWLVDWGRNPLVTGFDRTGRIAFRLELPLSSYRAVPVPRGAVTVAELEQAMEEMEPAAPSDR
jgi:Arylsulfotransferase (ASST)